MSAQGETVSTPPHRGETVSYWWGCREKQYQPHPTEEKLSPTSEGAGRNSISHTPQRRNSPTSEGAGRNCISPTPQRRNCLLPMRVQGETVSAPPHRGETVSYQWGCREKQYQPHPTEKKLSPTGEGAGRNSISPTPQRRNCLLPVRVQGETESAPPHRGETVSYQWGCREKQNQPHPTEEKLSPTGEGAGRNSISPTPQRKNCLLPVRVQGETVSAHSTEEKLSPTSQGAGRNSISPTPQRRNCLLPVRVQGETESAPPHRGETVSYQWGCREKQYQPHPTEEKLSPTSEDTGSNSISPTPQRRNCLLPVRTQGETVSAPPHRRETVSYQWGCREKQYQPHPTEEKLSPTSEDTGRNSISPTPQRRNCLLPVRVQGETVSAPPHREETVSYQWGCREKQYQPHPTEKKLSPTSEGAGRNSISPTPHRRNCLLPVRVQGETVSAPPHRGETVSYQWGRREKQYQPHSTEEKLSPTSEDTGRNSISPTPQRRNCLLPVRTQGETVSAPPHRGETVSYQWGCREKQYQPHSTEEKLSPTSEDAGRNSISPTPQRRNCLLPVWVQGETVSAHSTDEKLSPTSEGAGRNSISPTPQRRSCLLPVRVQGETVSAPPHRGEVVSYQWGCREKQYLPHPTEEKLSPTSEGAGRNCISPTPQRRNCLLPVWVQGETVSAHSTDEKLSPTSEDTGSNSISPTPQRRNCLLPVRVQGETVSAPPHRGETVSYQWGHREKQYQPHPTEEKLSPTSEGAGRNSISPTPQRRNCLLPVRTQGETVSAPPHRGETVSYQWGCREKQYQPHPTEKKLSPTSEGAGRNSISPTPQRRNCLLPVRVQGETVSAPPHIGETVSYQWGCREKQYQPHPTEEKLSPTSEGAGRNSISPTPHRRNCLLPVRVQGETVSAPPHRGETVSYQWGCREKQYQPHPTEKKLSPTSEGAGRNSISHTPQRRNCLLPVRTQGETVSAPPHRGETVSYQWGCREKQYQPHSTEEKLSPTSEDAGRNSISHTPQMRNCLLPVRVQGETVSAHSTDEKLSPTSEGAGRNSICPTPHRRNCLLPVRVQGETVSAPPHRGETVSYQCGCREKLYQPTPQMRNCLLPVRVQGETVSAPPHIGETVSYQWGCREKLYQPHPTEEKLSPTSEGAGRNCISPTPQRRNCLLPVRVQGETVSAPPHRGETLLPVRVQGETVSAPPHRGETVSYQWGHRE